jgi:hypothetical protein
MLLGILLSFNTIRVPGRFVHVPVLLSNARQQVLLSCSASGCHDASCISRTVHWAANGYVKKKYFCTRLRLAAAAECEAKGYDADVMCVQQTVLASH